MNIILLVRRQKEEREQKGEEGQEIKEGETYKRIVFEQTKGIRTLR